MKPASKTVLSKPMSLQKGNKQQIKVIEKEEIKPKTGFTEFPTAKLTSIKTVDPFSEKKGNSFAHLYSSGAIPCKIEHGSVHMRLKWNSNVVIARTPPPNKNSPITRSSSPASTDSSRKSIPTASSPTTSARK
jgi:hypothetical protein